MKRLHVHVAVDNLADSIAFYSGMFGTEPAVVKPDYAKWMLDDPRVNFAISRRGAPVGLNHLGIQVESADELGEMQARLAALDPAVEKEAGVSCCYARSDKYWINDPSGIPWETYHTLESIPVFGTPGKAASEDAPPPGTDACRIPSLRTGSQSSCCVSGAKKSGGCC